MDDVYALDATISTFFWHDAIKKEMKNGHVAFDILQDGVMPPPDHQLMPCHIIFDVKMEDFCHKARISTSRIGLTFPTPET